MLPSVRTLLNEIIDYAGLFPPAALGMSEAFDRFLGHLGGPDGWMMARFVCPASRLGELAPMVGRLRQDRAGLALSVLGRGGGTTDGFSSGVIADLHDIVSFRAAVGSRALVDQFEVRLPKPAVDLEPVTVAATEQLAAWLPTAVPFFEVSLLDGWRARLPEAVNAVGHARSTGCAAGLKIRCGGLEPGAVPSPVSVAAAIASCRRRGIPLKATQGLHHPVRRFDPDLETTVHGFLNVFVAGVLAYHHELAADALLDVLEAGETSAFTFDDDGLAFGDRRVTVDEIDDARLMFAVSFGSCSFDEPRGDLRGLGLLR